MPIGFFKKIFTFNKTREVIDYNFYRSVMLFENLTDKEISLIANLTITKVYKQDEMVYKENHPQVVIYIVKSGRVLLHIDLPHLEFKLAVVMPNSHFGEIGLFHDVNRISTATAMEDTELIAIKKSDLKQLILQNPATGIKLLYNFGRSVTMRLVETSKLIRQNEYN